MTIATVTPDYINDPKPGKKLASINCQKVYYGFDPIKIPKATFAKGIPITIEYETSEGGYHNIKRIVTDAAAQTANGVQAVSNDRRERMIMLQAIAKSCIEAGKEPKDADLWVDWIDRNLIEPSNEKAPF